MTRVEITIQERNGKHAITWTEQNGDQAMMLGRYEYWCPKCGKIKWTWKLLDNTKNKEDKK